MPIAFLEAMASGIAVIGGTRDGSLDPLADGMLGTPIDPENGEELTTAICTALRNADARSDRLGERCLCEAADTIGDWTCCNAANGGGEVALWVMNCRAISRNTWLLYPTKLPRQPSAIEAVKGRYCCKSRKLQGD